VSLRNSGPAPEPTEHCRHPGRRPPNWNSAITRYIILRHPEGVAPGTYFPEEYELEWFDREEHGLFSKIIMVHPAIPCGPSGVKLRNKRTGDIADVYEPIGAPPMHMRHEHAPQEAH
jgi:hypothetical protein